MTKKREQVAAMINERIKHGCYHTGVLPSLRKLADELGVNYLTVRQGLHLLRKQGVIESHRKRNFSIQTHAFPEKLQVALLEGAGGESNYIRNLQLAVEQRSGTVRRFVFSYPDDELLTQVPDMNFDLIFFHLDTVDISPVVLTKFIAHRRKMVSVSFDYTKYGIRSILEPEVEGAVTMLFELLERHRHQRYDILVPIQSGEIIERRVNAFRLAAEAAGKVCNVHRYLMPPYMFDISLARNAARSVFSPALPPDAVFVPTIAPALGVMRGLYDQGWRAGVDYSLVSTGNQDTASNAIPAITITTSENLYEVFNEVLNTPPESEKLEFYLNGPDLIVGESVRPAPE